MKVLNRFSCSVVFAALICLLLVPPRDVMAQKGELPITTTSDEARENFIKGRNFFEGYHNDDAKQLLEKAVELDPDFALAHLWLARAYGRLSKVKERNASYERALKCTEKVSEQERLFIKAVYASAIEGDQEKRYSILKEMAVKFPELKRTHFQLASYYSGRELTEKAIEEYKKAIEIDSEFGFAYNTLAYVYAINDEYDKALKYFEQYAAVSPGDANPIDSMAELYFKMGKLDEAIEKYQEALEIQPDFKCDWNIGYIYGIKEDYGQALKWTNQYIDKPPRAEVKAEGYLLRGIYYHWFGNTEKSLTEIDNAIDIWKKAGTEDWVSFAEYIKGWIHLDKGEFVKAKDYWEKSFGVRFQEFPQLKTWNTGEYNFCLGCLELKQERYDSAKSKLKVMANLLPEARAFDKNWIKSRHDMLHGEILLAENSVQKAIEVGENASSLGIPAITFIQNTLAHNVPFRKDVLARAYYKNGDIDKAIEEYERLIIFNPENKNRLLRHPTYHYSLGKLYEEKGLSSKAKKEYEMFLEIYKDADEDLPCMSDAKLRLKKLNN